MNYLAHIFLAGNDRQMQLGNFIADAVKGTGYKNYPKAVADGILMHRMIDTFTDAHPAVKDVVRSLKPIFGRYSGALADIFFDHLLASRFHEFSPVPLRRFSRRFYVTLIRNRRHLPARIKRFMWHFILTDRLARYATLDGIQQSLSIMVRYGRMDISVEQAVEWLRVHEEELWGVFRQFFEELQAVCEDFIREKT